MIRVYYVGGNVIETHDHTRAISKSRKVFCSRHVVLPAKMKFHDSAYRAVTRAAKRIRSFAAMRQLTVILTALTVATFQTHAGSLDWLFDFANNDDNARDKPNSCCGMVCHILLSQFREGRHCRQSWAFLALSRCNHQSRRRSRAQAQLILSLLQAD